LNYYSRGLFDWKLMPCSNPGETMTDMPYSLYAEGLLMAVHAVSKLGVPIYITETGAADAGDDVRAECVESYMAAIEESVRLGYDLRGVMYWTLVDNFEWAFGYTMKFGIYRWDPLPDGNQERKLLKSGVLLKEWFKKLVDRCPGHRKEAATKAAGGKVAAVIEDVLDGALAGVGI
jgi:beta-glucosidase/6-phospho-beta-glucosidase/beta-galactosidase